MDSKQFVFRLWAYFRFGYAAYISATIAFANLLGIIYLSLKATPSMSGITENFVVFVLIFSCSASVLVIGLGYLHFRKLPGYGAEAEVSIISNPYTYKVQPGYWRYTLIPLYLVLSEQLRFLGKKFGTLDSKTETELNRIEDDIRWLIQGGGIGKPGRPESSSHNRE